MAEQILVLVAQANDGLGAAGGEALGAGRALADQLGKPLTVAVLGKGVAAAAAEAAERGADRVLTADAESLARFSGDTTLPVAQAAIAAAEARVVLVHRFPGQLELCHRLAARLNGASVTGATAIRQAGDAVEVEASAFGGTARATYRLHGRGPSVIGVAQAVADAPERQVGRSAQQTALSVPQAADRVSVVQAAQAASGPRLEDARVVVSGGRGLKEGANYQKVRELAKLLGGMPGASRAIVDEGWATPAEQVGLTGTLVAPDLYIAIGISGASQHMMGCSNARMLVAVNTDPQAPIFQYANLGIVDDGLAVLPELIRLARQG